MTRLVVWLAETQVGELIRKPNGNLQFRYNKDYKGPPVSQALPVQAEAHPHASSRAVFGGLLPEGSVRTALAKSIGVSETNDFGLLEEVGGDCAGAIVLLPEGSMPEKHPRFTYVDEPTLDRLIKELPRRPLAIHAEEGIRLSLAGAQSKLPVIIDRQHRMALPTNSAAPTTHILKPEPAHFPGLVNNEAFCTDLARACDIQAPKINKATTVTGTKFLVVERYDRNLLTQPIQRLHQEDFCQALGRPSDKKYQSEGGPSVVECVRLIRKSTAVPAQDLPRLIQALIFNWIIGNCDAHAKNYSLLYNSGAPVLAPFYDLVSTAIYPEITTRLAMNIGGARRLDEIMPESWMQLAEAVGYRPTVVQQLVTDTLPRASKEATALVGTTTHDNDTARDINARIQRLTT